MDATTATTRESLNSLTEWVRPLQVTSDSPFIISVQTPIDYGGSYRRSSRVIKERTNYAAQRARLKLLKDAWITETKNCSELLATDQNVNISIIADDVLGLLSNIEFEDAAVELSPFDAIKITLVLRSDPEMLLVVTRPFYNLADIQGDQVVFSIFNQDDHISHVLPLSALVEGISAFLAEQQTAKSW